MTYTEPTQDQNGNALTDLSSCTVYVSINGGTFTVVQTITASSGAGGGTNTIVPTVIWGAVPSRALPLNWEVKCTNGQGLGVSSPDQITTLDPYPLLVP